MVMDQLVMTGLYPAGSEKAGGGEERRGQGEERRAEGGKRQERRGDAKVGMVCRTGSSKGHLLLSSSGCLTETMAALHKH